MTVNGGAQVVYSLYTSRRFPTKGFNVDVSSQEAPSEPILQRRENGLIQPWS